MKRAYMWWAERLSEGRVVGAAYDSMNNYVLIRFSRRLTPEFMGDYRSVSELNEYENCAFELSKNRRSLISNISISVDAAMALKKSLKKITPAIRFKEVVQGVAYPIFRS